MATDNLPHIPAFITVHLGPPDSPAPNITIPFTDYIKGVASSQILPGWPDNAIRAAIYPMVSFALNRIYNNYYRSKGYNFDITSSPQYDQLYVYGGDLFANINRVVDQQFNRYLVRPGAVEPFLAPYCSDPNVECDGFPLWGGAALAQRGFTPYQILTTYYGNNLNIVTDVPFDSDIRPFPGIPLMRNMTNNDVRTLQIMLNRISSNFSSIPNIYPIGGYFGSNTEDSVKRFQSLFGLTSDGVVDSATWYQIANLYYNLQQITRVASEINTLENTISTVPDILSEGQSGNIIRLLQSYLYMIGFYINEIPIVTVNGLYDSATKDAVTAFQKYFGLNPTGIVDRETWAAIYNTYKAIVRSLSTSLIKFIKFYPGTDLTIGATGSDVVDFQNYLSYISDTFTEIPKTPVTGYFGERLQEAVIAFQKLFGLNPTGIVDEKTWNAVATEYSDLLSAYYTNPGQYPGYILEEGV